MSPCVVSAVLTTFLTTEFFWPCWLPCFENYGTDVSLLIECSHLLIWTYYSFLQDRIAAFQMFAVMYIKYIQIFRRIEECYDQVPNYSQFLSVTFHALTDSLKKMNWTMIPEDKKSPLKFCKLHVFIFSPLLRKVDWLIEGFEMNNDSRGRENSFNNLRLCKLVL